MPGIRAHIRDPDVSTSGTRQWRSLVIINLPLKTLKAGKMQAVRRLDTSYYSHLSTERGFASPLFLVT